MTERSILIVEDNPVTRKMLRIALECDKYTVIEASDARSALRAVEERTPGLILQDLILPDMNGFELVERLRAMPGLADIPIIALSGFRGELDNSSGRRSGFTEMLLKPIEPEVLANVVAGYLPRPELERRPLLGAERRVLLIDDDVTQLKLLRLHLVQLGFIVATASSAPDGLALAHRTTPDIIVSDVLMPDMDGYQLCLVVRSEPRLARVPIVLMSAHYHTDADHDLAARVGANAIIVRTPDFDDIAQVIFETLASGPRPMAGQSDNVTIEHTRAVIRQLARQLALAAGLARRCTLQGAQLSLLGGIAEALARRSNSDTILRDVLAATLDAAAISKGALFLRDPEDETLTLRHGIGFDDSELTSAREFFGQEPLFSLVIEGKLTVSIPTSDFPEEIWRPILRQANVATAEIVPLVSGGIGIGAIMLGAKRTDMTTDDSVTFARAIGNQIVQSLELERTFVRLAESELRYRTLMEHANDGIAVFSPDGVIREVNHRFLEIFGEGRDDLMGRSLADFIAPDAPPSTLGPALASVEGEGRGYPPVEITRRDKSAVLVEFSTAPLELQGEPLVLAIGRDVTAQVRARAQLMVSDRLASMGAMAAGVAHEINNPLAAVIGNLEIAQDCIATLASQHGPSPTLEDLGAMLSDAQEAAVRVKVIVADTKLLSRGDDRVVGPVDVRRVIESAIRMTRHEVRHRATLVIEAGDVMPVLANESRLGQVLINLIVNAAQAIPEGHANQHRICVRAYSGPDAAVMIEVEDTGQGIAEEDLRKIFTPFFTTKPNGVGTGLGLAICERIITELGGEITLTSRVGRGTRVLIRLPSTDASVASPSPPEALAPPTRRGRILVVDDEVLVGALLRRQLGERHDITVCTRAEEALTHLGDGHRFDVILCDLMMPTMTGIEFHDEVGKHAPDHVERIVFITGGAFTSAARAFMADESKVFLEKPFEARALHAVIEERLRQARQGS